MFSFLLIVCALYQVYTLEECSYLDYLGKKFDFDEIDCPQNRFCNDTRLTKVQYIDIPLFFYKEMKNEERTSPYEPHQKPVHQLLRRCCGCLQIKEMPLLNTTAELDFTSVKDADFIYPFFSTASTEKMHGYYYLPLIDIPGMLYASEPPKIDIINLFNRVAPVCLVNVLLCIVAGFIGWLTETWGNEEEFPRGFLIGWYEGAWWAFVSMTTVGYGDKAPRTFLGRIFSLMWITIGIVAYGLLTGIVYTEVDKINSPPPNSMSGMKVGSLLFREYDAMMIANNGCWAVQNTGNDEAYENFYTDFLLLLEKLEEKEINGIALDQFTFMYVFGWKKWMDDTPDSKKLQQMPQITEEQLEWMDHRLDYMVNLITVEIPQKATQPFTYGILVKSYDDYAYLKRAAHDLRYTIQREWNQGFQVIKMMLKDSAQKVFYSAKNELYSHQGKYFQNTLITIAVLVVFIVTFGAAYELKRRGRCGRTKANVTASPVELLE